METSKNSISSDKQMNNGEVTCEKCKEGTYEPYNPSFKENHYFKCGNCGDIVIVEPNVIVE